MADANAISSRLITHGFVVAGDVADRFASERRHNPMLSINPARLHGDELFRQSHHNALVDEADGAPHEVVVRRLAIETQNRGLHPYLPSHLGGCAPDHHDRMARDTLGRNHHRERQPGCNCADPYSEGHQDDPFLRAGQRRYVQHNYDCEEYERMAHGQYGGGF